MHQLFSFQSHVVSAFEHSLANMTDRLTKLTTTSEKKVRKIEAQTYKCR